MTTEEFYTAIGGDYSDAKSRLINDAFMVKFIGKFINDKNYEELKKCLESGDFDTAFSYAHTLKGVSLNLAFKKLSEACVALTDALREPARKTLTNEKASELLEAVTEEYNVVTENIKTLCG